MNTFGASAPLKELVEKFGFTPDAVSEVAREVLAVRPTPLRERPAWAALERHHAEIRERHLRDLFAEDATRGERLAAEGAGIYLDYSKNRVTDETLRLLLQLAEESGLRRAHRGDVPRRPDQHDREPLRPPRRAAHAEGHVARRRRASTSSRRCTRCSTAWPRSRSASARASGRATRASRSATSSTSASAAPTSAR